MSPPIAQTTADALKILIENLGLNLTVYRDQAPPRTARPYVEVTEVIALAPDPLEDAAPSTALETVQVDLWQNWKVKATTAEVEDPALAPALIRGIHGQRLPSIGTSIVYMVRVAHSIRLFEPDENIVHHAITVEINREL